jgi:N-succinyldiaminopimelate aminotransferase
MTDIRPVTNQTDVAFAQRLVEDFQVAVVPGSGLYHDADAGGYLIRFTFCKTVDVLEEAGRRLLRLKK